MSDREHIVWKHNGDTTADIDIAQEPVVAKVCFSEHIIIINGVRIKLALLQRLIREYEENSRTASKMMQPPF
tara:strand:- start:2968 stop:3183 length:216 start_codon:yes stop_codon:yes gene_type:complete